LLTKRIEKSNFAVNKATKDQRLDRLSWPDFRPVRHGAFAPGLTAAIAAGSVPGDAGVMELVDMPDLGSGGASRAGSSPVARTKYEIPI
jgi:hypothetical protein